MLIDWIYYPTKIIAEINNNRDASNFLIETIHKKDYLRITCSRIKN